ncbi:MAG: hypothetical protein FWG49_05140, partial [Leptospirales bacterium]|nr:hypothetical protein [Leptospirales bacterium]
MKIKFKIFSISILILLLAVIFVIMIDLYISRFSASYLFDDYRKIPENKCGLLLGTSKYSI